MDEEISAFSLVQEKNKSQKDKKKKKKKSLSNDSTVDIKELISKRKKELANDGNNSIEVKKKRKQDVLEEKEGELWKTHQILNPPKKRKKYKGAKSIFSNVNVLEKTHNFFFESDMKNDSKKKSKLLVSSTPKPPDVEKSPELASSKEAKKKKLKKKLKPVEEINSFDLKKSDVIVNGYDSKPKKQKIPKSVRADSVKVGENVFAWMISPVGIQEFFSDIWEKKPMYIAHKDENFFNGLCSLQDLDETLKLQDVYFNKNIDVTAYQDGQRYTLNPMGRARPPMIWDFFQKGRSIRMLNPQTFIPNVANLTSSLQEFFRCFVGANLYLTPPASQGFAPHYDDIEAFVLQLEGEKEWLLYNPRTPEELLPRVSSPNFSQEEIGEPILKVTLKPGDLLYFPRGIIHQAKCVPGKYSLHITVSCYQKNSWADLFEKMLPAALSRAIDDDCEFRKGLPLDFLDNVGLVHSDSESENRQEILQKFEALMQKLIDYCPLDAAADQMGREFMHSALPPCLTKSELAYGLDRNDPVCKSSLAEALKARLGKPLAAKLVRNYALRLVCEEDNLRIYYNTDNEKEYHAMEEMYFEIPERFAQAVDQLIHNYPEFTQIKDLPFEDSEKTEKAKWADRTHLVYTLWEKGLILFDVPVSEI